VAGTTAAARGRIFSARLKVRENHVLLTAIVYKFDVRSVLAPGAAQALSLPNWLAGSAGLVGFGLLSFGRVEREEQMMIETFGEDYRAHMARTSRVVPRLY